MSLPRWSETLLEYIQLVETPPEIYELKTRDIMLWQCSQFLEETDYSFNVFETEVLNNELKEKFTRLFLLKYYNQQVSGACVPEYRFKLAFERLFLEKIDRYNARLKINLKSLIEIEETLFQNYDLKTVFNESTNVDEDVNTNTTDNTDYTSNRNLSENRERDTQLNKTQETDNTNRNFNRAINENTPDGQLNLTTNDGSGIITTANEIDESLETGTTNETKTNNDTENQSEETLSTDNQTYEQDKIGTRITDKTQLTNKENERHITGYQNLGSKPKLLQEYENMYQDVLLQFVNCFDKLFRHVY